MPDEIKTIVASSENDYTLLNDAYYGTGGFRTGTYLERHTREIDDKFNLRKRLAYYLNYVQPLVDSHVNPIFRKDAMREPGSNDAEYMNFLEDVDTNMTPLAHFVKHAALNAKLKGSVFVVVDSPKNVPATKADALKQRAFPYCFIVDPEAVTHYLTTKTGRIIYFAYREASEADPTIWYKRVWTETEWSLSDSNGGVIESGTHNLGMVPVVCFRSRYDKPSLILPPSEFMPIGNIGKQLFNRCSWWDEILLNQAFSLLIYPAKQADNIIVGVNNAIGFDGINSAFAPAFIAPPAEPADMIKTKVDFMIAEVYRMAGVSNVTGVKEALSGKAKEWDFESLNNKLSSFAFQCQITERRIVNIYAAWTKQDIKYKCVYPNDFSIPDVTAELDNALKAQTLSLGPMFEVQTAKRVISVYLPDLDEGTEKQLLDDIEKTAQDKQYAEPLPNDNNNGDQNTNKNTDQNNDDNV